MRRHSACGARFSSPAWRLAQPDASQTTTQAIAEPVMTTAAGAELGARVDGRAGAAGAAATDGERLRHGRGDASAPARAAAGRTARRRRSPPPVAPAATRAEPSPMPPAPASRPRRAIRTSTRRRRSRAARCCRRTEQARIIAELEALAPTGRRRRRRRQCADRADQAEPHGQAAIKQIEARSAAGALQNDPDCAATADPPDGAAISQA